MGKKWNCGTQTITNRGLAGFGNRGNFACDRTAPNRPDIQCRKRYSIKRKYGGQSPILANRENKPNNRKMKIQSVKQNYSISQNEHLKITSPLGAHRTWRFRPSVNNGYVDLEGYTFAVRYTIPDGFKNNNWYEGNGGATASWGCDSISLTENRRKS